MALPVPGKQNQREVARAFFGVNTRLDPTAVEATSLISGVNVDLYEIPGVIICRRGLLHYLSGMQSIRFMMLGSGGRLVIAGDSALYVDGLEDPSLTLTHHYRVSMVRYRSRVSSIPEIFIANGIASSSASNMYRYGSTFAYWGVNPPRNVPVVAAGTGGLTGNYSAKYTYARYGTGFVLLAESNPSPASAIVALAGQGLNITVEPSTDPGITNIVIYRTVAGGSVYLLDQIVANALAVITSTTADGGLGGAVDEDNDRPRAATLAHVFRDRIFTNDVGTPGRIRWTTRFSPEYQPANNFTDIIGSNSEAITAINSINGVLIVFTESAVFRLVEQASDVLAVGGNIPFIGADTDDYQVFELPVSRGCVAPNAVISSGKGLIYPNKDGLFVISGDFAPETLLSAKIQNLFLSRSRNGIPAIDFAYEHNMCATIFRGRYYLSYTSVDSPSGQNDWTMVMNLENQEFWFWDLGFTHMLFDDVRDRYLGGDKDGGIQQLERPDSMGDNGAVINVVADTPNLTAQDPMIEKLFLYMKVDAKVHAEDTLTAIFHIDDVLHHNVEITGNRTRDLIRLPGSGRGFAWRIRLGYSGTHPLEIHSVETQFKAMGMS